MKLSRIETHPVAIVAAAATFAKCKEVRTSSTQFSGDISTSWFHARIPHSFENLPVLDETDVLGLFSEALTADVKTILSDETGFVCADTARSSALAELAWTRVPD